MPCVIFSLLLLIAASLLAETLEETYQAAVMAEKGQGDLEKAIQLYEKVVEQHSKEAKHRLLAARAQLRLGICQEKLGLKKALPAYGQIDQPQALVAAAHPQSTRQEKKGIEAESQEGESAFLLPEAMSLEAHQALVEAQEAWRQAAREFRSVFATPSLPGRQYAFYAYAQPRIPYSYKRVAEVPMKWKFLLDLAPHWQSAEKGIQYSQKDFDDSTWSEIQIGQAWEDQGYPNYDQGAWYRARIEVDARDDRKPVYMAFGGVDLHGYVYINGQYAGEHHVWDEPFILDISEVVDRRGENAVAIYVYDGMGMGGIYGLIDIHQPTSDEDLSRFVANRGGSVRNLGKKEEWSQLQVWRQDQGKRYAAYAYARPYLPYPCQSVAEVPRKWRFTLDYAQLQSAEYSRQDFDDSKWSEIQIGQAWEDQGYPHYDEGAWYRAEIEVNARDDKKPIYMAFGGVDKDAWVYVNGELVGEHHVWDQPFTLDISKAVEYHGRNTVAIYVYDGMGMGGIYGLIEIYQKLDEDRLSRP